MMKRYLLIALTLLLGLSTPVLAQQGMLKAFGLKGKVKTVTFDDQFVIAFDPDGNFIASPEYHDNRATIFVNGLDDYGGGGGNFSFQNGRWISFSAGGRFVYGVGLEMTSYDEQNRPIMANAKYDDGEIAKRNVAITYSGSDSHGNYTKIYFDTSGVKPYDSANATYIPEIWNVEYEYWPEDATMADVARPMTDAQAAALIKKANLMDAESLSKKFRNYLNLQSNIPYISYRDSYLLYGLGDDKEYFYKGWEDFKNSTLILIDDEHVVNVPNLGVEISGQRYSDDGESVDVLFFIKNLDWPDWPYRNDEDPYSNLFENLRHAVCVFEDGKWRVANVSNKVENLGYPVYEYGTDWWLSDEREAALNKQLAKINSGEFEREVRQKFASDPKLPEYIDYIKAFKQKLNNGSEKKSTGVADAKGIFTEVEDPPMFPGGEAAMYKFLSPNIRYPETAARFGIQGRVVVQFVVEKDGSIGEIKVVRSVHPDLDREAVRVVKSMPKFIPGKMNGEPVRVWYTLPVNFRLQ